MQIGPLSENHLKNSVLSNIRKHNKSIKVGAGIGSDFSNMDGVITSDGVGKSPVVAWNKAMNNFLCSGGRALGARITMMLSANEKQSSVSSYMKVFEILAAEDGVQILGGHSEVLADVGKSFFLVNLYGEEGKYYPDKKGIKAGFDIVMAGYAGILGTNQIAENRRDELLKRFSDSFINTGVFPEAEYSLKKLTDYLFNNAKVYYFHDISDGGVFSALWQLGVWADKGFEVDCRKVRIKQETVEFCETVDANPYLIDGTGGAVFICEKGRDIVTQLSKQGIEADIIGKISDNKARLVQLNDKDRRTLAPNLTSF